MINYVTGDATAPIGEGTKVIVHCCNDIGGWGAGFVLALSKKWAAPEQNYRQWAEQQKPMPLGSVQFVQVEPETFVVNLIGQSGVYSRQNIVPIRYNAIKAGFKAIIEQLPNLANPSIHMPRIGCGLAGGSWEIVEEIINETFIEAGISVTVYDFA